MHINMTNTTSPYPFPTAVSRVTTVTHDGVITIRFLISAIIIFVNACIICVYCCSRHKLLAVLPNRLLLSLSVCELQTGLAVILNATCDLHQTKPGVYRIIMDIYTTFLVKTAVLHLCGITLDRYLSLFYALKYQSIVTKRTIKFYMYFSWGAPFFISILQFSWLHKVVNGSPSNDDFMYVSNIEIWYSMVTFIVFVALPMVLLGGAFLAMILEIRRLLHCIPGQHMIDTLPRQRRVVYVFCSIYITFLVLAMPYFTLRLLTDIHYWKKDNKTIDKSLIDYAILLKNLASAINPVLYATTTRGLRTLAVKFTEKLPTNSAFQRARNHSIQTIRSLIMSKDYPVSSSSL